MLREDTTFPLPQSIYFFPMPLPRENMDRWGMKRLRESCVLLAQDPFDKDIHVVLDEFLVAFGRMADEFLSGQRAQEIVITNAGYRQYGINGIKTLPELLSGNTLLNDLYQYLNDLSDGRLHDQGEIAGGIGKLAGVKPQKIWIVPVPSDCPPDVLFYLLQRLRSHFRDLVNVVETGKLLFQYRRVETFLPSEVIRNHGDAHTGSFRQFPDTDAV